MGTGNKKSRNKIFNNGKRNTFLHFPGFPPNATTGKAKCIKVLYTAWEQGMTEWIPDIKRNGTTSYSKKCTNGFQ